MELHAPSPEPIVHEYSFIFECQSAQKEPSHEKGKTFKVTVHGAPGRRKVYIQWGAVWFHMEIVNDTAITALVPCSSQHEIFHLGFGRLEPH
jgi:hypothetical protein